MKKGTAIRVKDTDAMRAWKLVNEFGTVTGPDPRGFNKDVVAVKLDRGPSILEIKGVHISNLDTIED
ncbi:MAG: hypothetical protein KAJ01_07060 [Candidatus Hydrogenedentes bacterium]|nr:hypothetical protein [Candidatus Hydrogenedentota bacterium]